MKIQHFDNNGKDSFFKKFFFSTFGNNSDDSKTDELTSLPPLETKLTELFDRVGRHHLHDFTSGNICIFGDDLEELEKFSNQICSKLAVIDHALEVIDAEEFSKKQSKASATPFLIKVSRQTPSKLIRTIIQSSATICVLKLKENEIVCPLDGSAKSSFFAKELIDSLGGNCALRRLIIASLAKDEFLLIENTCLDRLHCKETVRCFQTIIKQLGE